MPEHSLLSFYLLLCDIRKFCFDCWKLVAVEKYMYLSPKLRKKNGLHFFSPFDGRCLVCFEDLVLGGTVVSAKNVFTLRKGRQAYLFNRLKKVLGKHFAEDVVSEKICSKCERNLMRFDRYKLDRTSYIVRFRQTCRHYKHFCVPKVKPGPRPDNEKVAMLDMVIHLIDVSHFFCKQHAGIIQFVPKMYAGTAYNKPVMAKTN